MSHELRTPLNAIMRFSELITHSDAGDLSINRIRQYATDIHNSGALLLDIIIDLLDLAKIETGRFSVSPQPTQMHRAVEASLKLIRHLDGADDLTFRNEVAADFPPLMLDEMAFRQILMNLLSNAVKATSDQGVVTIRAGAAIGEAWVEVADTGVGIPPDLLAAIFDAYEHAGPNYVRTANNSGLGLSIVKRLVELHGGAVKIKQAGPDGTVVRTTFPDLEI